jgi:cyclase
LAGVQPAIPTTTTIAPSITIRFHEVLSVGSLGTSLWRWLWIAIPVHPQLLVVVVIHRNADPSEADAAATLMLLWLAWICVGDDGVVVIDTFASADAARQLLAEIRKLTKLPIKFVINTHYHLDHVAGDGVFVEAGAVVLAQRNVRGWIHTENLRLLRDGLRSAGRGEITSEQTATIEGFVRPMVLYDKTVDVYFGSREIHVRSVTRHTGGDSVVLVPDAKTDFCGDLFFRHTLPNLIDASTKPWVETLDLLAKSEPDYTFVPGHGDVGNAQDMTALREYLVTLRKLVSNAQAQGKSGDALAEAVSPELTDKYGQGNFFTYFAKPNILQPRRS